MEKSVVLRYLLRDVFLIPQLELEYIMSIVDDINAIGAEIDAVAALLPADIASAVAAQKAADDAANAANVTALADAQTAVNGLAAKVAALKTAAGAPTGGTLTVSPSSVSAAAGVASATALSISGGAGPYSIAGLPSGATFDGTSVNFDATTVAGSTTATISDSETVPATATLGVSIS